MKITSLIITVLLIGSPLAAQKYPHTGIERHSMVGDGPNTYTAYVDGVGEESCTFYDSFVACADTSAKPEIPRPVYLNLDVDAKDIYRRSSTEREESGPCDDATKQLFDEHGPLDLESPFPYRIEGNKVYIPYHIESGSDSGKKYLFVSRDDARVDGEACIQLAPPPKIPASVLPIYETPTLPPPPAK